MLIFYCWNYLKIDSYLVLKRRYYVIFYVIFIFQSEKRKEKKDIKIQLIVINPKIEVGKRGREVGSESTGLSRVAREEYKGENSLQK